MSATPSPTGRYGAPTRSGYASPAQTDDNWPEADGDAPTVAEMPMREVYNAAGYPSTGYGEYETGNFAPGDDSARTMRILVGILCLVGSFVTAVAAIILALQTFH